MSGKFILDFEAFGAKLRKKRQSMDVSQETLSEKCGISVGYYANLERGAKIPSVEILIRIANYLYLDLNHLFASPAPKPDNRNLQAAVEKLFKDKSPAQSDFLINLIDLLSENIDKL